jgi:probable HAF family extracellular repeat protein
MDINESGQIVGTSSDTGKITRFVLWENGAIRALALAPEAPGWATHAYINDRGQIAVSAAGEAFFWSAGNRQSLVAPGGPLEATGLNENGEVAGTFLTGTGEQHVFVWSQSRGMVDLGTGPHGFTAAWAVGMNSRGDIIGYTAPCELDYYHKCGYPQQVRAILWRKTTP